ncbi:hypothetical protein A7981_05100 [Methylovorus sp. MM2]|uniref:hypothetical protein n=1 Tax=Methylovorus sp. MM2 TaxID=1848038 RepID=UPI0007E06B1D|nr:hypothetical protein [Methylovorus sp. MM2]OAM52819.1 hypothetical protein A7981_05100 [Methylovorus sp. MM2]
MSDGLLSNINHSRGKFYFANGITLGLYGAIWVVFKAGSIGKLYKANFPTPSMGLLLTVLTLGIYPGILLTVLAYKLASSSKPSLGNAVLALNLASLFTAFFSGGILVFISIALWAHAGWLVVNSANMAEQSYGLTHHSSGTPNGAP